MQASGATLSMLRRFAPSALLAGSAVQLAALFAMRGAPLGATAVATGALASAAVAYGSRRLLPQVFARAVSWLVLAPSAIAFVDGLASGGSVLAPATFALSSGAALLAGAPLLHTPEAHATFAPVRFRRTWLTGATAAVAGAMVLGAMAVGAARWGAFEAAAFCGLLAVALAASARGVLAMRGWSVLLGGATSIAAIVAAVVTGFPPLLLAAVPGLLLASPIALSRVVPHEPETHAPAARVRVEVPVRVAVHEAEPEAAEHDDLEEAPSAKTAFVSRP